MCLGIGHEECVCREAEQDARALGQRHGGAYNPYRVDPNGTTSNEADEADEAALDQEMMAEAKHARPDSIDWARDGDTRHWHDD